jgi:hypothetical protein
MTHHSRWDSLDEGSAHHRDLYVTTRVTHMTSMPLRDSSQQFNQVEILTLNGSVTGTDQSVDIRSRKFPVTGIIIDIRNLCF